MQEKEKAGIPQEKQGKVEASNSKNQGNVTIFVGNRLRDSWIQALSSA